MWQREKLFVVERKIVEVIGNKLFLENFNTTFIKKKKKVIKSCKNFLKFFLKKF